jgi:putative ABC transport system ATP-binding protein
LLRLVEIEGHADKLPSQISGGQQQRVAIARALANDPAMIVADEPTGSLDSTTAEHIFEVFEHLVSELGKTIIMVTHDQTLASRFTRTLEIADGELIQQPAGANGPARGG